MLIVSEKAIGLAYGPEAERSLAAGAWPGWTRYAPGWWQSPPRTLLDTSAPDHFAHPERYGMITVTSYREPTVRVSVQGGSVLWEERA